LSFASTQAIALGFGLSVGETEKQALEIDIFPLRYARNRDTISSKMQLQLFDACVAIVGCGGLGGHVAQMLARVGVGNLILIDHDIFEEHNLNRQNFSTFDNIGEPKAEVLKRSLKEISPTIQIRAIKKRFDPLEDFDIVSEADVIVDALDQPQTKLDLSKISLAHAIPFVHGAVAGTFGQIAVNSNLEHLYHNGENGSEDKAGNLSFAVTHIAAMQASEVVKIILGIGETLDGKILMSDLLYNDSTLLPG
jgi:molybdopterin/thiamine biosynthesis adenylyltransferase